MAGMERKYKRELRTVECSYTLQMVKSTKDGDWEYVEEKLATATKAAGAEQEELNDLWEGINEDE